MRGFYLFLGLSLLLLVSFLGEADESKSENVYVVYMGALRSANGAARTDHAQLLSMLTKRKNNSVVQTYNKSFSGFAARLTKEEANSIARKSGVVTVFPDRDLKLHTTRSWDFLNSQSVVNSKFGSTLRKTYSSASSTQTGNYDSIIGMIDTGISPNSASFADTGMAPVRSNWSGTCHGGKNFTCNKKLIGARYYPDSYNTNAITSALDADGHGTHAAGIAGGALVAGASYNDLANGSAIGGSPRSRISVYAVCRTDGGCPAVSILKAFDDAISDRVDVISVSIGYPPGITNLSMDAIAIGSFHAWENQISVVCSAGNDGPSARTVVNVAPWILTVGATTIDRQFQANIVLADNVTYEGGGINFSRLNKTAVYPLVEGALSGTNQLDVTNASNCVPGALDVNKVRGTIVLCRNKDVNDGLAKKFKRLKKESSIVGMIVIDNDLKQLPSKYGISAIATVTEKTGALIRTYIINSTSNPSATILPSRTILGIKPAPTVSTTSSRGPVIDNKNLIKPDITAPGVGILAAWPLTDKSVALAGKEQPFFNVISGTSVSCPHVAGLVAVVKARHPTWSPSAIKSAIMTTATQTNNLHGSITTMDGSKATPYDIGAGEISLSGPLKPGLVYETETIDYIQFLCNLDYKPSVIRTMASTNLPRNFGCPINSSFDLVSDMNYPSIAVSGLKANKIKIVKRTVTNVGEVDSKYTVNVEASPGLQVQVVPNILVFTENVTKISFEVVFMLTENLQEDKFGSFTWTNGKYNVRSPFAVSNA